jgi:ACT-domain-containing protein, predicted allosteric regulator of homoserine dehydrogenase
MTDGDAAPQAYTIRLELADEPGQLLAALAPIADAGGNLLSIFHERGNITPRGRIPVVVDLECPPERFTTLIERVRGAGVNIVEAGADRLTETVRLLITGPGVAADLDGIVTAVHAGEAWTLTGLEVRTPEGSDAEATVVLELIVPDGDLGAVRSGLAGTLPGSAVIVEPLETGGS